MGYRSPWHGICGCVVAASGFWFGWLPLAFTYDDYCGTTDRWPAGLLRQCLPSLAARWLRRHARPPAPWPVLLGPAGDSIFSAICGTYTAPPVVPVLSWADPEDESHLAGWCADRRSFFFFVCARFISFSFVFILSMALPHSYPNINF